MYEVHCYTANSVNSEFPETSYDADSLEKVLEILQDVFLRPISGIVEVVIHQQSGVAAVQTGPAPTADMGRTITIQHNDLIQLRSKNAQLQKQFESAQDRFTISWGLRVFQGLKQHKGDLDAAQHITMAARDVLEEAERER